MAIEQFRLLAAIMFADIVGYAAIMQENEAKAKRIRDQQREVLEEYIEGYHGRIIQYYGDGTLSIFGSAIEAVKCAVKIQHRLKNELEIPLRIGLHLGDIVYDDEGAYGDAVNVAARIEALSVGGCVLISDRIQEELKNHPEIKTESLGEYKLKHIDRPMPLYAIVDKGLPVPDKNELQALTGSVRRSIAVLPFVNMSADPENEYFSDGITEEIINALSNVEGLDVSSRTSVFMYKNISRDIRAIGSELSVNYILEGSVRKWGKRIRITAQLINPEKGFHIWSENFDRDSKDIFDLQDEIARKIAARIKKNFSPGEQRLVKTKTKNIQGYNDFLKGKFYWHRWTTEDALKSIDYFQKAIDSCPNFAEAYARIAYGYSFLGTVGRLSPKEAFPKAEKAARKALKLDDQLSDSQLALALVRLFYYWDTEGTKAYLRRALAIKPYSVNVKFVQSLYLTVRGKHKAAIRVLTEALEKNPLSLNINAELGRAYLNAGRPVKALEQFNATLELDEHFKLALEGKGWAFVALGDYDDALNFMELHQQKAGQNFQATAQLGYIYGKTGQHQKAQQCLDTLFAQSREDPKIRLQMDYAIVCLGMGDYDRVFDFLQQALDERLGGMLFLTSHPIWNEVKSDDRFYDLVKKIGVNKYHGVISEHEQHGK